MSLERRPSAQARRPVLAPRHLLAALLCVGMWHGSATTFRFMTPVDVLSAADLVFLGTVTDVVTESRDDQPWTLVSLSVDDLFLGFGYDPASADESADGDELPWQDPAFQVPETVTLAFLGGDTQASGTLLVSGSPTLRREETYLVAAYQQDGLASPIVGFRQGVWRLDDEGFTDLDGTALAVADDGRPVRADVGAGASQVLFAVRSVLAGDVEASATEGDVPATGAAEGAQSETPSAPDAAPADPAGDDAASEDAEDQAATMTPRPLEVAYDVADEGGPLLLSESVARAAQVWRDAIGDAVDLSLVSRPGSADLVRYGPDGLFGSDTFSLTTVASDGAVTVYVSPTAGSFATAALVHELGVLIGLREGGTGVMASALTGSDITPTAAEVEELVQLSLYQPADLTRDGVVDFADLLELAARYGERGVNLPGDIDGDGTVDDADLDLLEQSYRFSPLPAPAAEPSPSQSDAPAGPAQPDTQ